MDKNGYWKYGYENKKQKCVHFFLSNDKSESGTHTWASWAGASHSDYSIASASHGDYSTISVAGD